MHRFRPHLFWFEREGRERVRESERVRVRDPLVQIKKHASSGMYSLRHYTRPNPYLFFPLQRVATIGHVIASCICFPSLPSILSFPISLTHTFSFFIFLCLSLSLSPSLSHTQSLSHSLSLFPKSSNKSRSLLLHALLHNNNGKDSYTFRPRRLDPKVQLQSSQARSVGVRSVPRRLGS
eukprot:sb/3471730/